MSGVTEQIEELKKTVADLEQRLKSAEEKVRDVRNSPIISGYQGKRLVLDDHLTASYVMQKINSFESRITALE